MFYHTWRLSLSLSYKKVDYIFIKFLSLLPDVSKEITKVWSMHMAQQLKFLKTAPISLTIFDASNKIASICMITVIQWPSSTKTNLFLWSKMMSLSLTS